MTVVVGFVPEPQGAAALEHAISHARQGNEKLVVIHGATLPSEIEAEISLEQSVDALDARLEREATAHEVRLLDAEADAADAILSAASESQASLIVIGLRRRSPVGKLLMGSTSQRVLLNADCPVLAVKAPQR